MHSSINHFLFFSLFFLFFNTRDMQPLSSSSSDGKGKLFDLQSLSDDYLTFLGDSHHQYDAIVLTKAGMRGDAPRSAGMVLYNRPILFVDSRSKKVPSFSTRFAFSIRNIYGDRKASGDGLAFLISPNNDLLGSPGYFGLVDSTDLTRNKFIAIEFDTRCDPMFQDPNDNHLGLDINSLFSVQLATPFDVDLRSGDVIYTWIDYKSDRKRLEVFLSPFNMKPAKPLLKVDIDLFKYVSENMFVGFSAATEGSMQLTRIEEWEFTVMEFSPPSPPPSSSTPESLKTFPNPAKSGHRHNHLSRLAIGLTVGVSSVPISIVFCWFCWKKLTGMQTIRSSGGTSCQEIQLSIPNTNPHEVARSLIIEKVLENEAELIRVIQVKPSIAYDITFV